MNFEPNRIKRMVMAFEMDDGTQYGVQVAPANSVEMETRFDPPDPFGPISEQPPPTTRITVEGRWQMVRVAPDTFADPDPLAYDVKAHANRMEAQAYRNMGIESPKELTDDL